jgi:hypothetical protein
MNYTAFKMYYIDQRKSNAFSCISESDWAFVSEMEAATQHLAGTSRGVVPDNTGVAHARVSHHSRGVPEVEVISLLDARTARSG